MLFADSLRLHSDLLIHGQFLVRRKIAAAAVTEDTAARTAGPVQIRAGQAGIHNRLLHLAISLPIVVC